MIDIVQYLSLTNVFSSVSAIDINCEYDMHAGAIHVIGLRGSPFRIIRVHDLVLGISDILNHFHNFIPKIRSKSARILTIRDERSPRRK